MPMKVGNDDFNTNSDDLIIHNIMNKDICTCIFLVFPLQKPWFPPKFKTKFGKLMQHFLVKNVYLLKFRKSNHIVFCVLLILKQLLDINSSFYENAAKIGN